MVSDLTAFFKIPSPFAISIQVNDLILPTDLSHTLGPNPALSEPFLT